MVSLRKSYSSSMGYSNSLQRFLTSYCGKGCMGNCNNRVKKQGTYVNFRIVDLEGVHVIVVFLDLIYDRVVSYLG